MKSNIIPYSNTQTINLDTYTTPTITNTSSSIAKPNTLFNINKVNTYTNKTYTPLSPIQKLQTYETTLNNNTILNPTYNVSTYNYIQPQQYKSQVQQILSFQRKIL